MIESERRTDDFSRLAALKAAYPRDAVFEGESPDGVVSVSMQGDGTFTAVRLSGSWRRVLEEGRLAHSVAAARAAALRELGLQFVRRLESAPSGEAPPQGDLPGNERALPHAVPGTDRMAELAALAAEKPALRGAAFAPPQRSVVTSARGWFAGTFTGSELVSIGEGSRPSDQVSVEALSADLCGLLREGASKGEIQLAEFSERFPATAAAIAHWRNR